MSIAGLNFVIAALTAFVGPIAAFAQDAIPDNQVFLKESREFVSVQKVLPDGSVLTKKGNIVPKSAYRVLAESGLNGVRAGTYVQVKWGQSASAEQVQAVFKDGTALLPKGVVVDTHKLSPRVESVGEIKPGTKVSIGGYIKTVEEVYANGEVQLSSKEGRSFTNADRLDYEVDPKVHGLSKEEVVLYDNEESKVARAFKSGKVILADGREVSSSRNLLRPMNSPLNGITAGDVVKIDGQKVAVARVYENGKIAGKTGIKGLLGMTRVMRLFANPAAKAGAAAVGGSFGGVMGAIIGAGVDVVLSPGEAQAGSKQSYFMTEEGFPKFFELSEEAREKLLVEDPMFRRWYEDMIVKVESRLAKFNKIQCGKGSLKIEATSPTGIKTENTLTLDERGHPALLTVKDIKSGSTMKLKITEEGLTSIDHSYVQGGFPLGNNKVVTSTYDPAMFAEMAGSRKGPASTTNLASHSTSILNKMLYSPDEISSECPQFSLAPSEAPKSNGSQEPARAVSSTSGHQ